MKTIDKFELVIWIILFNIFNFLDAFITSIAVKQKILHEANWWRIILNENHTLFFFLKLGMGILVSYYIVKKSRIDFAKVITIALSMAVYWNIFNLLHKVLM